MYAFVEYTRLFQASKGNKVEQVAPFFWSSLFTVSVVIFHVYYMYQQTYVYVRVNRFAFKFLKEIFDKSLAFVPSFAVVFANYIYNK